jgi:hypothetical protein
VLLVGEAGRKEERMGWRKGVARVKALRGRAGATDVPLGEHAGSVRPCDGPLLTAVGRDAGAHGRGGRRCGHGLGRLEHAGRKWGGGPLSRNSLFCFQIKFQIFYTV